ncbi:MAG: hypothetical protein GY716_20575 [bacterium]|nr:hypothetical protein [bacterium]
MKTRRLIAISILLCAVGGVSLAQWSTDPALNLAVSDPTGDQVQPKLVTRPGGGYYVSWFDNRVGGYDVYLQLLDEQGVAQWTADGVLVADRGFSSTQDYGLGVDTAGNALLVFRDDRFGGTQITATRVDASGAQTWGAGGVQLTSGSSFLAAPKIAGTSDGEIVAAWKSDAEAHMQRLDAAGAPQWPGGVVISDAMSRDYTVSDLRAVDGASVIVSLVFQPSGFNGPKHLYAQKVSDQGAFQWGVTPVAVFDGGSLQFGNFPPFVTDGAGGAVFSWYDVNSGLKNFVQRIESSGAESFPHNGVAVSTSAREQTGPAAAYDAASGSTFVFWPERQPGPTPLYGIYAQRLDGSGARQWGNEGVTIESLGTADAGMANVQIVDGDAMAFWARAPSVTTHTLHATRVDADGNDVWSPALVSVSTAVSGKSRLGTTIGPAFAVLAWSDDRAGDDDIFVQNVNADGTLGPAAAGPGAVDQLAVDRTLAPLELTLTWAGSCSTGAVDYAVFEGTLASLQTGVYDHEPVVCSDAAPVLQETFAPAADGTYYLVAPLGAADEGSYGADSSGGERPQATPACIATQDLDPCP